MNLVLGEKHTVYFAVDNGINHIDILEYTGEVKKLYGPIHMGIVFDESTYIIAAAPNSEDFALYPTSNGYEKDPLKNMIVCTYSKEDLIESLNHYIEAKAAAVQTVIQKFESGELKEEQRANHAKQWADNFLPFPK